jgi:DNA-binding NarL/FixJ family response regulator
MQAVILTSIRLLGDGLSRYLAGRKSISIVAIVKSTSELRDLLAECAVDVVLIDVTQEIDLDDIRAVAIAAPKVALLALGLREQRQDVIRCGRAGFSGYVSRDASMDELALAMEDAIAGRLACPAEISNGLLRALFRSSGATDGAGEEPPLTLRERSVLTLIGRGCTNKEIARELQLSVTTVKHHVHNVLGKLNLPRRAHAMQRVRERPWLGA